MKLMKVAILIAMYVTALSARAELPVSSQMTSVPFLATSSTFDISTNGINFCKEDYKNVEADAYDFMAGEPMTLALEELLDEVRANHPEVSKMNDHELVSFILSGN